MRFVSALLPLFVLALAACGSHRPAADDEVDANALAASLGDTRSVAADPALRAALRDPIMSDPMLVSRANADAIRPPVEPYAAPIPVEAPGAATPRADIPAPPALPGGCPQCRAARGALTLAALAESQGGRFATCAATIGYSAGWAMRVALPLVPGARVREAAGSDADGCALRIVSFHSDLPPAALVGWYARAVKGLAHRVDGDDHLLTTDSVRILARPWPGYGSEVILMTSAPR